MSQLGVCDYCRAEAIVVANGRRSCIEHLDHAMAAVFEPMKTALKTVVEPADGDEE